SFSNTARQSARAFVALGRFRGNVGRSATIAVSPASIAFSGSNVGPPGDIVSMTIARPYAASTPSAAEASPAPASTRIESRLVTGTSVRRIREAQRARPLAFGLVQAQEPYSYAGRALHVPRLRQNVCRLNAILGVDPFQTVAVRRPPRQQIRSQSLGERQ